MDIQVKETSKLGREITVIIPEKFVAEKFDAKLAEAGKTIKIDGFRPGKVPASVVKERYGDKVFHDLEHELLEMGLSKALKDNELNLAGQPKIDHDHTHEVKDFKFTANIEIFPKFTPKGTDKIKLTKDTSKPNADMTKKAIEELAGRMKTFKESDKPAKNGDKVTVTGQGYSIDGKKETAFEGGNLQDFPIELGSNSLIPGFEEQLEGLKVGDKKDVKVDFPEEYHAPDLAGKPAVFKLTVDKIEAAELPEMDDAFAKELGQTNMAKLEELIEKSLQRDLDSATTQRLKRNLFDHLDAKNKFDLPESLVERELGGLIQTQINQISRQGLTPEQAGFDIEKMKVEFKEIAERRVKLGLLLAEIAKQEKMEIGEVEIRKAVLDQVAQAGAQAEQAKEHFSKPENRQQLVGPLLEEKVTTWLLENAKIDEKTIKPEELMKEFQ